MNQIRVLTETELRTLLNVSIREQRPVVVDWVNRTISVLSEEKVDYGKVLSTGPMVYRDVIYQVKK